MLGFTSKGFIAALIAGLQLTVATVSAESLSTYVEECKTALNLDRIPGYSCTNGIFISSSDGLQIPSSNNYIGTANNGNPNVDAVFLCRNVDTDSNTSGLNGYILQNRINGYTCFFDAIPGATASNLPDLDSASASSYWREPDELADECQDCHSNDPFIVSRGLAFAFRELQLLYGNRPYLGAYHITSTLDPSSHFYQWESEAQALWLSNSCADSCHRLSTGLIASLTNELLTESLMSPPRGSIYDDVPASYLVMASIW